MFLNRTFRSTGWDMLVPLAPDPNNDSAEGSLSSEPPFVFKGAFPISEGSVFST